MTFAYPTADVGPNTYLVYIDPDVASAYLGASLNSAGQAWAAATSVTQAQALISATRWLDNGRWQGAMTDPANPLQWPRTGLSYPNGQSVDPNSLPVALQNACAELAAAMVDNPDLRDELQNPTPSSLDAGTVRLQFFRPLGITRGAKDVQVLTYFPTVVMDMVGMWLQGSGANTGPLVEGVCKKSPLDDNFGLEHGL